MKFNCSQGHPISGPIQSAGGLSVNLFWNFRVVSLVVFPLTHPSLLYLLAGHWVCISQDCKKTDSNGSETPHSETPPSYRCNSSTLQFAGFVTSNGGGLANSPRAMSKIMPPMSNVKTRAIRKSWRNKDFIFSSFFLKRMRQI